MFNNLSRGSRKKLLLNIFLYYPLGLVIAILLIRLVLKYVGLEWPLGLIIVTVIFSIFIAIKHIQQIYKNLLAKEGRKKSP
jgi:UPF0716 family protein affecting phage T7 exclusion